MDHPKSAIQRELTLTCGKTALFSAERLELLVGPCCLALEHEGSHDGPSMWVLETGSGALLSLGRETASARWGTP